MFTVTNVEDSSVKEYISDEIIKKNLLRFCKANKADIDNNDWIRVFEYLDKFISTAGKDADRFRKAFLYLMCKADIPFLEYMTEISEEFFSDCDFLEVVDIPDTIKQIRSCAFHKCNNLVAIKIPKSIEEIENYSFGSCDKLFVLQYAGTSDEWCNVERSMFWNNWSRITAIHCSDGITRKCL